MIAAVSCAQNKTCMSKVKAEPGRVFTGGQLTPRFITRAFEDGVSSAFRIICEVYTSSQVSYL